MIPRREDEGDVRVKEDNKLSAQMTRKDCLGKAGRNRIVVKNMHSGDRLARF